MRNSRPDSSQRTELLALANLQNFSRRVGTAVRGFSSSNTRVKISSGVSKKIMLCNSTVFRILLSGIVEQQNLNAPIFGPAGLGIVGILGVVGSVALYREARLGDAVTRAEDLQQVYAAGGR